MRDDATTRQVSEASRAAGRFQLMANAHLSHPNGAALERDGRALMEALILLGFRPPGELGLSDDAGSRNRHTE